MKGHISKACCNQTLNGQMERYVQTIKQAITVEKQ